MKKSLTNLESDRFGLKTIFHAIMGILILLVCGILSSLPFDLFYSILQAKAPLLMPLLRAIGQPLINVVLLLLITYFYITKILKLSLTGFRICKPRNAAIWILCAIVLPIIVSCFFIFLTPGTFAITGLSSEQIILRVLNAILSSCLVAGITEEVIFRGFIMRLLEMRWNKYIAIIAPSFLFGVLHIFNMDNPNIVDILMLLIAGTSVGVMFSMIAYQSGSIWPGAIVHGIWNLIIVGMILEISGEPGKAIITYTLHSNSTLLTGGAFGIEASIPAVIGYGIVIILAWIFQRRISVANKTRSQKVTDTKFEQGVNDAGFDR